MAIYKENIIRIDLEKGNIKRTFCSHAIGMMDQQADHFGVEIYRDGEPVDLTGVTCQGVFMPPVGDPIAITGSTYSAVDANRAEVILPQACYNYDGPFTLAIKLVDSTNSVTGTMRIVDGVVDNTHASGTVAPTGAVPTYQEVLSTYDAMVAATAAANGAIAATYSSSATYAVGDYCIHDGGLYRCTTAITTSEAWTAGHWTAAKIGSDLVAEAAAREAADYELKSTLNEQQDTIALFDDVEIPYKIGDASHSVQYATGELSSSTSSTYGATDYIDIRAYSSIKYKRAKSTASTTSVGMAFYNANKEYISGISNTTGQGTVGYESELYEVDVPTNAMFARFSILKNSQTYGNFQIQGSSKLLNELTDINLELDGAESTLKLFNSVNAIPINYETNVSQGITFTSNHDGSYTVSGTASSAATKNLVSGNGRFPYGIGANSTFKLSYNGYSKVRLQLFRYINGSLESGVWKETIGVWDSEEITLGGTVTGLMIRLRVESGMDISTPVTVMPVIMTARSNENISNELEGIRTEYYGKVADSASEAIKEQFDTLVDGSEIDFSEFTAKPYSITVANKWATGTTILYRSYIVEIPENTISIKIETQSSVGSTIAFLKTYSDPPTSGDTPDFADGMSRIAVPAGSVVGYPVTKNMKYIYVTSISSQGVDILPDSVVVYSAVGGGGTVNNYYNTYENTYDITVTPTITTDTNGWLAAVDTEETSEADATDMTYAIMAMLTETGYCHLGEGVFFVSGNIDMPENSTLCGCGKATTIRLLSSVTTGYAVRMRRFCTVKDLAFRGSANAIEPTTNGYRDAIRFTANKDGTEGETAFTTRSCMISNVWINYFSGSGIYCHNTSQSPREGLYATNMYIMGCYAGINIDYMSEFCKFTNVVIGLCYYGCINNGGNNVFTACTFHGTSVGFYIDGSQENAAHGTINGCTFCHTGSNVGKAVDLNDIVAGFVIANCQFWYNSINVTDSNGILFTGCEFGRGTTDYGYGATINIDGGNGVIFSGCSFNNDEQKPPVLSITNNTKTIFSGCYGGVSGAIIPNSPQSNGLYKLKYENNVNTWESWNPNSN